jgi:hypothetical protein
MGDRLISKRIIQMVMNKRCENCRVMHQHWLGKELPPECDRRRKTNAEVFCTLGPVKERVIKTKVWKEQVIET